MAAEQRFLKVGAILTRFPGFATSPLLSVSFGDMKINTVRQAPAIEVGSQPQALCTAWEKFAERSD
jgi:hypothetical protein